MKLTFKIALCGLMLCVFHQTFSQDVDSIPDYYEDTIMIESTFDANLDSISNLWYVGEAVDTIESITTGDTLIPDFSDQVLMNRLSELPCIVELSYNAIVRKYIEMYANKRKDQVERMLGLSEYYFPIFGDIFDYYGIPNELKYLAIIESALNPGAYSRARAVGIWQFMYGTGRLYGLTINSYVDERRDPIKSTHAAARFLKDLYNKYHDWTLAIAAYNCGPGNVSKAIRRSGGKTDYWDIYFYLPRETRGYVPAFVAANYIMNYYEMYNLRPQPVDFPFSSDTIMVTEPLHLDQVAEVLNIPLKQLRDMNPQYRYDIIPATQNNPYSLRLPDEQALTFIDLQNEIFSFKDSVYFNPEKTLTTPTYSRSSEYLPEPPGDNMAKLYYSIKQGDNLGFIADWYHIRISDIKYWNNIRGNVIRHGQKLVIYVPKSKAGKYSEINNMSFAEKQKMIGKDITPTGTVTSTPVLSNSANTNYILYTVKENDTIWEIAKKYPGTTDIDIMRLNNITHPAKIKPGQILKIMPVN